MSKYVAYVSSYTNEDKYGISIYDVDVKNGRFKEKERVLLSNSSYLTISHNRKYLYSITDAGVVSYKVLEDGNLEQINTQSINGMRGCYLSTSYDDKFLFVAGYHDGKITVLKLKDNGSVSDITDEIFLKGMGSVADRNYRPHVCCVKTTRDDKYLLAADLSNDHVNVYSLNKSNGKLSLADIIRSDQESAPKHFKFSKDGKYLYILHEHNCNIDVYTYENISDNNPSFERIQSIAVTNDYHTTNSAASAMNFSEDFKFILSSTAGDNCVSLFKIEKDGTLTKVFCLPISGEYPKDAHLFPDNKHLVSLNHESKTMTFFTIDDKKGTMVMNGPEMKITSPNCIIFHKLSDE